MAVFSANSVARFGKRSLDIVASGIFLLGTAPLLALVAAIIWIEDGRPVIFRQTRAGKDGELFAIYKLRTMRRHEETADQIGQVDSGHTLVTRVGRILRRLKVDEILQLVNVISGQMSLVGPRPTIPQQVDEYNDFQRRRLAVKPGITGWAQVNGNVQMSWDDRIRLDVWYTENWTLGLDLQILLRTLGVIVGGEKINPEALEGARRLESRLSRRG